MSAASSRREAGCSSGAAACSGASAGIGAAAGSLSGAAAGSGASGEGSGGVAARGEVAKGRSGAAVRGASVDSTAARAGSARGGSSRCDLPVLFRGEFSSNSFSVGNVIENVMNAFENRFVPKMTYLRRDKSHRRQVALKRNSSPLRTSSERTPFLCAVAAALSSVLRLFEWRGWCDWRRRQCWRPASCRVARE